MLGDGRRARLEAIEAKDRLVRVDADQIDTVEDLLNAVDDMRLEHDGRVHFAPDDKINETIRRVHDDLPEPAAQDAYVRDKTLLRRINAARKQFNTWLGRTKRWDQMPGPMEAGPSKYNFGKRDKRRDSYQNATEELRDKLDRIAKGARGGRQRALNAIGSSVAEQNASKAERERDAMRDQLNPGMLVQFRNPSVEHGEVVRVNKKTVTAKYPNPRAGGTKPLSDEPEPDTRNTRVDLDSDYLTPLTDDKIAAFDETDADTVEEYREELFGDAADE